MLYQPLDTGSGVGRSESTTATTKGWQYHFKTKLLLRERCRQAGR
jgi:hypothetical protein